MDDRLIYQRTSEYLHSVFPSGPWQFPDSVPAICSVFHVSHFVVPSACSKGKVDLTGSSTVQRCLTGGCSAGL